MWYYGFAVGAAVSVGVGRAASASGVPTGCDCSADGACKGAGVDDGSTTGSVDAWGFASGVFVSEVVVDSWAGVRLGVAVETGTGASRSFFCTAVLPEFALAVRIESKRVMEKKATPIQVVNFASTLVV